MNIKKKLIAYTALVGTAVGVMHMFNRFMYRISTMENRLSNETKEYFDWTYGRIYYQKEGSGSPILLIHDLDVCSSTYEWHKIKNELSKTNTVYSIDLLGCGLSEKPNLTYTNFLYVQLISDFIREIIKDKTDVIATGHSSSIALMTCANDASLINRIMLVNPESLVESTQAPSSYNKICKYVLYAPIIGTFIYNIKNNKKTIGQMFRKNYFYDQNKIREKDILTYVEASQAEKAHGKYLYANIKSKFTNSNVLNCLPKINNSIYILIGNNNPENSLIANQYQNHLPSIEITGIDQCKYLPQLESPAEFIENIKIYFEL